MIKVLKKVPKGTYWSKSQTFLLPLTGLKKTIKYTIKSYLFWEDYSIENYQIMVVFLYDNYDEFVDYCKKKIFPVLDKNGYLIESYDFTGCTVFVLDISEWALDIELFIKGKYSKLSNQAKNMIIDYHTYYDKENSVDITITAPLHPFDTYPILDNMTAIDYVAEQYELDAVNLRKVGELASIYEKENETLTT